jgi:hypothetical protein
LYVPGAVKARFHRAPIYPAEEPNAPERSNPLPLRKSLSSIRQSLINNLTAGYANRWKFIDYVLARGYNYSFEECPESRPEKVSKTAVIVSETSPAKERPENLRVTGTFRGHGSY